MKVINGEYRIPLTSVQMGTKFHSPWKPANPINNLPCASMFLLICWLEIQ